MFGMVAAIALTAGMGRKAAISTGPLYRAKRALYRGAVLVIAPRTTNKSNDFKRKWRWGQSAANSSPVQIPCSTPVYREFKLIDRSHSRFASRLRLFSATRHTAFPQSGTGKRPMRNREENVA